MPSWKDGPANRPRLLRRFDGQRDEAFVIAVRGASHFLDDDAALGSDRGRRDDIDVDQRGTQQPSDRGRRQRLDFELGDGALVSERDLLDRRLRELAGE